jgi:hypothetical protein
MSEAPTSRIVGEKAVPLRGCSSRDEEPPTTVIEEKPVPLRLGAERVEAEEREARLRLLTGRRPRKR